MSNLNEYLEQKRGALAERRKAASGDSAIVARSVRVKAEGRSGVRRIRIRDFQIVSDSPPDFAGYDLGPGSPEILLGALGSCLTHTYLIQAADLGVPLDSLEVEVTAKLDPRAGLIGKGHSIFPDGISYTVQIDSPASTEATARLREAVERACPVLNFLQAPRPIKGELQHRASAGTKNGNGRRRKQAA
ncbi:MAG TPA: OsmC family protein [Xanthobacteraceae bacterium]|nr:OsmC family protein [Xanthobacteraceae bacterium]